MLLSSEGFLGKDSEGSETKSKGSFLCRKEPFYHLLAIFVHSDNHQNPSCDKCDPAQWRNHA